MFLFKVFEKIAEQVSYCHWCKSNSVHSLSKLEKIAKWLIKIVFLIPILTLKGNICGLKMMIGRLIIAPLPEYLCCAMVPPGMARVFTKHKQVILSALWPTGGRGLSVHRRGSVLLMIAPDCVFLSDRVRSKCRRQTVQVRLVLGNVRSVCCAMQ